MIAQFNQNWHESTSPHSLALANAISTPSGQDQNPLLIYQKAFWGAGMQGCSGGCEGMGILGTPYFDGPWKDWGIIEWALVGAGALLLLNMLGGGGRRR